MVNRKKNVDVILYQLYKTNTLRSKISKFYSAYKFCESSIHAKHMSPELCNIPLQTHTCTKIPTHTHMERVGSGGDVRQQVCPGVVYITHGGGLRWEPCQPPDKLDTRNLSPWNRWFRDMGVKMKYTPEGLYKYFTFTLILYNIGYIPGVEILNVHFNIYDQ